MAGTDNQAVTARNIAVVRGQTEKLNRGDTDAAVAAFAEDTRNFGRPVDRKGVRLVLEDIWRTFPDWHFEILDIIAAGDSVVVVTA